jgi:NAD(P)-dependent dehydrogenase (short-subunit alcohol dehydrogenase family)
MVDLPRHVLVIGASSGIGKRLAERLSASGGAVTAVARRADRLVELERCGAQIIVADMADLASIPAVIKQAVEAQGPLSALVYCAGAQKIKPLRMMSAAEVEDLYRINLTVPTLLAGQFTSRRVSRDDGVFCVISSIAAQRPEPGIVAYGASKAGADALIHGLAREMGPRRAVGVAPGWLDTEMTQAYGHLYSDAFKERLAKDSPAGAADVEAVVDCIEFLLSRKARFITGEVVRVDGGAVL